MPISGLAFDDKLYPLDNGWGLFSTNNIIDSTLSKVVFTFTGTIAIPNISNLETAVAANTAKTGITSTQASNIIANNAKVTFPGLGTSSTTALAGNTAIPVDLTSDGAGTVHASNYTNTVPNATNVVSSLVAATSISNSDKGSVRSNIGAGTSSFDGAYSSLSSIPSTFAPVVGTGSGDALAGNTTVTNWSGASSGLTASTGRTSLGATTLGSSLFTATNPSAITFLRVNANNTVDALSASDFRTAIGAGSSTDNNDFLDAITKDVNNTLSFSVSSPSFYNQPANIKLITNDCICLIFLLYFYYQNRKWQTKLMPI